MGLIVDILRHGQASYSDSPGVVHAPDTAYDLTPRGVEDVRELARELFLRISPDEQILFWSSPAARALHTARVLRHAWIELGIRREALHRVRALRTLQEWRFDNRNLEHVPFVHKDLVETRDQLMHDDKLVLALHHARRLFRPGRLARVVFITHDVVTRLACAAAASSLRQDSGLEPAECIEVQVTHSDFRPHWASASVVADCRGGNGLFAAYERKLSSYLSRS